MKSRRLSKLQKKSRRQHLSGTQLLKDAVEKIIYEDLKKTIKCRKYISKRDFKKILHKEAKKHVPKSLGLSKKDEPSKLDTFMWKKFNRDISIYNLKKKLKTLNLLLEAEKKNQNRAKKMYTRRRILSHKIPPTQARQNILSYL